MSAERAATRESHEEPIDGARVGVEASTPPRGSHSAQRTSDFSARTETWRSRVLAVLAARVHVDHALVVDHRRRPRRDRRADVDPPAPHHLRPRAVGVRPLRPVEQRVVHVAAEDVEEALRVAHDGGARAEAAAERRPRREVGGVRRRRPLRDELVAPVRRHHHHHEAAERVARHRRPAARAAAEPRPPRPRLRPRRRAHRPRRRPVVDAVVRPDREELEPAVLAPHRRHRAAVGRNVVQVEPDDARRDVGDARRDAPGRVGRLQVERERRRHVGGQERGGRGRAPGRHFFVSFGTRAIFACHKWALDTASADPAGAAGVDLRGVQTSKPWHADLEHTLWGHTDYTLGTDERRAGL